MTVTNCLIFSPSMSVLKGKGKRSLADVKRMVERKRATTNMGLPQWGKDLPEDVSYVCVCRHSPA